MESNLDILLFGAGDLGRKALYFFGKERVKYFIDNNPDKKGTYIEGVEVKSFDDFLTQFNEEKEIVVISVDARKIPILAKQLEDAGVEKYTTYLEQIYSYKTLDNKHRNKLEAARNAMEWIKKNTNAGEGIINNTVLKESYPEVTGYFIPTLIEWGEKDIALSYAEWLASIQHEDGAWYDARENDPYIFDTAQILKGLVAIRKYTDKYDLNFKRGCDWILTNIDKNGRLNTPSKNEWGDEGVCSELIHLYCLSPLYDAGKILGDEKYIREANRVAEYYISNYKEQILDFGFLSHFYAYVMEALCDIGYKEVATEAMNKLGMMLEEKGYIPAYKNVDWVCSTGMFQLAIVWFKLGNREYGNKCFDYASGLQNKSGGWYGSYPVVDNPNPVDVVNYPNYFPREEISWAVKYFLDALYWKNKCEFDSQASSFHASIDKEDERYRVVLENVTALKASKICDVGCGKGRYLINLSEDAEAADLFGVDMSEVVMKDIPGNIICKSGTLTNVSYPDESFDVVYTAEALEHSVFVENALRELLRIVKKDGKIIVIDKNKSNLGTLEIDEWEQWFDDDIFDKFCKDNNCSLEISKNLSYENQAGDGLFSAWIITKK